MNESIYNTYLSDVRLSVKTCTYYITLCGIFSSAAIIKIGINFQLFYIVLLFGSMIMLWLGCRTTPKWLVPVSMYLVLSGVIGVIRGTDTWILAAKQVLGICVSAWYFWNFFKLLHYDIDAPFETYCQFSVAVSVIGISIVAMHPIDHGQYNRLQSILQEPTFFAMLVLPAWYFYLYEAVTFKRSRMPACVITAALVLSASSNAYLSMLVGGCLLLRRYGKYLIVSPILIVLVILGLRQLSPQFRMRWDDTVTAAQGSSLAEANLSTYALLANAYVAGEVFRAHPLLGNGLGSHPISHEKYLNAIPGWETFEQMAVEDENAADGASLLIRLCSEQGLLGLLLVAWFVFAFYVKGTSWHAEISNAIVVYFFIKLLRAPHYFFPEQFFFITIYVLNWYQWKQSGDRIDEVSMSANGVVPS